MVGCLGKWHHLIVCDVVCVTGDIVDLVLYVVEEAEVNGLFVEGERCCERP